MTERYDYHVIIDRDDDGNPVYNLTRPNRILEMIVAAGFVGHWSFTCSPIPGQEWIVHLYNARGSQIFQGENQEEANRKAVTAILNSDQQEE